VTRENQALPKPIPGAAVKFRIGKKLYVLYNTSADFGPTLASLGLAIGLSPDTILDAIVSTHPVLMRHNGWAVNVIYLSDEFRNGWDPNDYELRTTISARREALRAKRRMQIASNVAPDPRDDMKWQRHVVTWPNPRGVLALPLSSSFAKLLDYGGRYRAIQPNANVLDKLLDELVQLNTRLERALRDIEEVAHRNRNEVMGLVAMASVADVLIDYADPDEITNLQKFKVFVEESVLPVASRRLLTDPEYFTTACAVRDATAKEILALLRREMFLVELRLIVDNRDVVEAGVDERAYAQLQRAAMLLLKTNHADEFVEQEVLPAMRALQRVSGKPMERFLAAIENDDARTFLASGWSEDLPVGSPLGGSALAIALTANNIVVNTVTNVEGPMALGVAVFAISAPRILERFAENPLGYSGHRIFSAAVVRMLIAHGKGDLLLKLQFGKVLSLASELPAGQRVPSVLSTYKATFELLNENVYRSASGRQLTGLLLMVALMGTLSGVETPETAARETEAVLQVLAATSGAALGIADLMPVANALEKRLSEGLFTLSKRGLGAFVAGVGVYLAACQLKRDVLRGDDFAEWIDTASVAGGGLALFTWLLTLIPNAPAGVLTFGHAGAAVAAVVLIAAGVAQIIDIVRSVRGPEAFVSGVIEYLDRGEGDAHEESAMRRAQLDASLATLRAAADAAHFFRFPESARAELARRGFEGRMLAMLMAD
jgi:hypothetical protein